MSDLYQFVHEEVGSLVASERRSKRIVEQPVWPSTLERWCGRRHLGHQADAHDRHPMIVADGSLAEERPWAQIQQPIMCLWVRCAP